MDRQRPPDGIDRRTRMRRLRRRGLGARAPPRSGSTRSARFAREQAPHAHATDRRGRAVACRWTPKALNRHQLRHRRHLSELIIPQTDTPGARATLVDRFIDGVLAEAPADGARLPS